MVVVWVTKAGPGMGGVRQILQWDGHESFLRHHHNLRWRRRVSKFSYYSPWLHGEKLKDVAPTYFDITKRRNAHIKDACITNELQEHAWIGRIDMRMTFWSRTFNNFTRFGQCLPKFNFKMTLWMIFFATSPPLRGLLSDFVLHDIIRWCLFHHHMAGHLEPLDAIQMQFFHMVCLYLVNGSITNRNRKPNYSRWEKDVGTWSYSSEYAQGEPWNQKNRKKIKKMELLLDKCCWVFC